ncbi:MAG: right-handed parallel beta-helix repeat-containing protein [Kiritimatiellae bacterium]|nr:right-handed parallel beta-helix repeat-containing protein [Kiritimatiellia bacterium]
MLKKGCFVLLISLGMAGCVSRGPDLTLYVSPQGSDENSGTKELPFATLSKARDAVRAARKHSALSNGVEVVIAGGRYILPEQLKFESQDSGVAGGEVVYRAADGAQVSITGSRQIPYSAFKSVSDAGVLSRLDPAAHPHVLAVELNALGFAKHARPGVTLRLPFNVPELYVDRQRMALARWPNQGWATIEKIISEGTQLNTGSVADSADPNKKRSQERKGGVFTYDGDRPARWNLEQGVWLHGFWCFDWYDDAIQVAAVDSDRKEITLKAPHQYGVRQGNPSPRRWRAVNLLEELDAPGEYYIDPAQNLLLLWPMEKLTQESCIALNSLSATLVEMKSVANFIWQGVTFEEGYADGCAIVDCESVRVEGCTFRNFRKRAASISGGRGNTISRCTIHDTGAGGLNVAGGERKTLEPAGHRVENCHIYDFSIHQLTYSSGIHLHGVGNIAAHNLLEGAPHMAVGISGNDHVFEYNIVSNVCMSSDDAGALYKGRNPSCRGNIIRYNLWKNIGSPRGHGNAAIYFDDGDGGDVVYGNIFYRCGDPGKGSFGTVFTHGGHDNVAENNIFIECKRALGAAPWNDQRWSDFIKAPLWQARLLQEVDITSEVYLTRYPALKGFMEPQPGEKRVNYALRNLFVKCGEVFNKAWEVDESNYATDKDPGFMNLSGEDFNLRKDSLIYRQMPGFEPIPLNKIGPQ